MSVILALIFMTLGAVCLMWLAFAFSFTERFMTYHYWISFYSDWWVWTAYLTVKKKITHESEMKEIERLLRQKHWPSWIITFTLLRKERDKSFMEWPLIVSNQ